MSSYKVVSLEIKSNEFISSSYVNTLGFNRAYIEVPSITSFCITATTTIYPILKEHTTVSISNTLVQPYYNDDYLRSNSLSTTGDIYLELNKDVLGCKKLYISTANTMTSTCTIRVHVSN